MGTVGKSRAYLRLEWLACRPALVETVAEEQLLADRGSPGLDLLALAALLESGRYDRHLRRMRTALPRTTPRKAASGVRSAWLSQKSC
jgi:GntR family transcriptional regulator/MocR family aminotransferase